jgi:Cu+-exporting ATPase
MPTRVLEVRGMHCGACVAHVEGALRKVPGVRAAVVNLATGRAEVETDEQGQPETLCEAVRRAGYEADAVPEPMPSAAGAEAAGARPSGLARVREELAREAGRWRWRAGLGLVIAAGVMGLMFAHGAGEFWAKWGGWLQFGLTTISMLALGSVFVARAARGLRHGLLSMDTLVSIGTLSAYGYSVWALLTRGHHAALYFDTTSAILGFLALGRYLEARARLAAAGALGDLASLAPERATRLVPGAGGGAEAEREEEVPVSALRAGDRVVVRPGGRLPVDGVVERGRSALDESALTGESMPVEKGPGDGVLSGALNGPGVLVVRAERVGPEATIARMAALVESAQASKAGAQRLADRVAGVFVPVVLVLALATLLGWAELGGAGSMAWRVGLEAMIAVLIVACPCALGLAVPTAVMVGTGLAARRGIIIKDAGAIERAGLIDTVILDKTGTLTLGRPAVVGLRPAVPGPGAEDRLLALAAAVERGSEHPLARAIVAEAERRGLAIPPAEGFRAEAGRGVEAMVAGERVWVGRDEAAEANEAGAAGAEGTPSRAETLVAVRRGGSVEGLIALQDRVRPEAAQVVARLKRELGRTGGGRARVLMLTGDQPGPAHAIAARVGIDEVLAAAGPLEKAQRVLALQQAGARVAVVGDGINDAPALAAADLGVAMGGGTDIAQHAGHVVLVGSGGGGGGGGGELAALPAALAIGRALRARIRLGLFWAFAYNVVLIPVAMAGWLHPMLAAGAMSLSSVSVVLSAWSLRFVRLDR